MLFLFKIKYFFLNHNFYYIGLDRTGGSSKYDERITLILKLSDCILVTQFIYYLGYSGCYRMIQNGTQN